MAAVSYKLLWCSLSIPNSVWNPCIIARRSEPCRMKRAPWLMKYVLRSGVWWCTSVATPCASAVSITRLTVLRYISVSYWSGTPRLMLMSFGPMNMPSMSGTCRMFSRLSTAALLSMPMMAMLLLFRSSR